MLLSRKLGETIIVGDEVRITVLGIKGGQVRIGMEAPTDITIHREEIYQRIKAEQQLKEEDDEPQQVESVQFRF